MLTQKEEDIAKLEAQEKHNEMLGGHILDKLGERADGTGIGRGSEQQSAEIQDGQSRGAVQQI